MKGTAKTGARSGLARITSTVSSTSTTALARPAPEVVAEFIRSALDRSTAYRWPLAARALSEGRPVRLTRRGALVFSVWRQKHRAPPLDLRAVEVEIAHARDLFAGTGEGHFDPALGLTFEQFATVAGIDRRTVSRLVEVIPPGPVPPLPPGRIPARQFGGVIRIFLADLRGEGFTEGGHRARHHEEASGPTPRAAWHRPLHQLLGR